MIAPSLPYYDGALVQADPPPDLSAFAEVELDFETDGVDIHTSTPVGAAVGTDAGTYYVAWSHQGGGNSTDPDTAVRWLRSLRGKTIHNHTTKFEIHMSRRMGCDLREGGTRFHDVSHSAALLDDHRKVFALETLAQEELKEGKLGLFAKDNLHLLPAGAVAAYAKRDVELVRRLRQVYAPRLAAEGLERVSRLEDDLIPAVVEMEANGMPLDLPLLETWLASSAKLLEKLRWDLYKLTGAMVNPDSPTDMTRLFLQCGEKIERTATGAPSFTALIVQAAAGRHASILLAWRIGKLQDLRSKYLEKYAKDQRNGVLYPTLHQLRTDDEGTVSGRFSCVRPNLQQVMGKDKHHRQYAWLLEYGDVDYLIKRLFIPVPGQRFFSSDAKQIEYRVFVHLLQSPRLLKMYADNPEVNFHHIVRDMILPAKPDLTHTETKVANFLSIFGGGVGALSRNLGITIEAAEDIAEAYDRQFPEKRQLLDKAMARADSRGYVTTLLKRRTRFPGRPGHRERIHKALNGAVQGGAADLVKLKMVSLYERRRELDLTMRMMVHDQFVGDLPGDDAFDRTKAALAEQDYPLSVVLLWDSHLGSNWAEAG